MLGKFDAAEMPRLDAFDEEFVRDRVAIQCAQERNTRLRFWTFFSITLGSGIIGVLALAWSAAEGRLRHELQSAVMAPIAPGTRESLDKESIASAVRWGCCRTRSRNSRTCRIKRLKSLQPPNRNPATQYHPRIGTRARLCLSFGIESWPEGEEAVPIPRRPLIPRPPLRRVEKSKNRGQCRERTDYC